jgi:ligand-binding SRPBCC domain-containing protein
MAFYQLTKKQIISASVEEVWDFISTPKNLKNITPESMDFRIISQDLPEKMYAGMIIHYTLKPLMGIRMTWVTEITRIEPMKYFIDVQRIGPYAMWHHQHFLEPAGRDVLMTDIVSYQLPFGFLGSMAHSLFIRKQLKMIFDYREIVINQWFSKSLDPTR